MFCRVAWEKMIGQVEEITQSGGRPRWANANMMLPRTGRRLRHLFLFRAEQPTPKLYFEHIEFVLRADFKHSMSSLVKVFSNNV